MLQMCQKYAKVIW